MPNNSDSQPNTEDFVVLPIKPPNPPSGVIRLFAAGGALTAIDSTGATVLGGSGGLTNVTSLPATCTAGTAVFLTVASTGFPVGQYNCIATNTFAFVGTSPANVINPTNFGVKMDVKMCRDTNAQFTTTTSVTCTTASFCNGTTVPCAAGQVSDVGKAIFGTCCGLNGGSTHIGSVLILPQGTITAVNSATNVTVSLAGNAATCAAGSSGCLLLWGTDDSTAWDSAWTAATGTAGQCKPIAIPGGMSFISTAKFLTSVCNTGITGPGSQGTSLYGTGYKGSIFVVLPNFVAAGCTGTSATLGNIVCFGPSIGFQFQNFGIWGGEFGNQASLNGKVFVNSGIDSSFYNVLFAGLASGTGLTMIGVNFDTSGQLALQMVVDGFGTGNGSASGSCTVSAGNFNSFVQSFCGNTSGAGVFVAAGAVLRSKHSGYGGSKAVSTLGDAIINGFFDSDGDTFFGCTSACANVVASASAVITFHGKSNLIGNGQAGSSSLTFTTSTAKVFARDSIFTGGAANLDVTFFGSMGTFFDQGGNALAHTNTAITPTCSSTGLAQTGCAPTAGSTNEKGVIRITAGGVGGAFTATLTFAGTFAGANAQPPACTFMYSNTGTGTWAAVGVISINSSATTAVTIGGTGTTAAATTFDIAYECTAR